MCDFYSQLCFLDPLFSNGAYWHICNFEASYQFQNLLCPVFILCCWVLSLFLLLSSLPPFDLFMLIPAVHFTSQKLEGAGACQLRVGVHPMFVLRWGTEEQWQKPSSSPSACLLILSRRTFICWQNSSLGWQQSQKIHQGRCKAQVITVAPGIHLNSC